ncbi:GAF domain-containing protein [Pleurocapsa sp. CCALA 161]|uniref:GAF domain-containing protein n=1 Tax=Pleurocapsa sp. CCALA 161 TaxID=2107688 RepID=UPI000D079C8B|nr:GAF domain-containing protein [Pleurocapsa sp. CCALA 161]PSB10101.1 GAF domain-containing protein [Pleurocapsa sp. CCALA 161]
MKNLIKNKSSDNLKLILNKICQLTNFPYGEIWFPNDENNFIELSSNYYIANDIHQYDLELFYECSQEFIMSKGEGLPGRVFLNQKPEWMLDVSSAESEDSFLRNTIAGVCGVKTGFAVPVKIEKEVLMIMVFFTCELRSYSAECLALADLVIKHSTSKVYFDNN